MTTPLPPPKLKGSSLGYPPLNLNPAIDTPFFFFGQFNICRHLTNYFFLNCFRRRRPPPPTQAPAATPSQSEKETEIIQVLLPPDINNNQKMDKKHSPPSSSSKNSPPQGPSCLSSSNKNKRSPPPPPKSLQDSDTQTQPQNEDDQSPSTSQEETAAQNQKNKYKRPGARINVHGPVLVDGVVVGKNPTFFQAALGSLPTHNPNTSAAVGYTMGNQGIRQHVETSTKTGVFHLSKAKLHEFPPELAKIVNALRSIDLSENKISLIPQNISAFVNLKHLNLSHNQIEVIPDQIGQLSKLETLSLANNRIKVVPSTIAHLQKLRDANLSSNQLSAFPTVFSSLKFLTVLDLAHNHIPQVPDGVGGLQVVELILNQNQVRSVSKDLARCPNLKTLRLQENTLELGGFPKEILMESQVSLLSLEGNLFDVKQLSEVEGYDQYMERYTTTKKKLS